MPYDNQQQRPAPPAKVSLTAEDAETIARITRRDGFLEFPAEDIGLMWDQFPPGPPTIVMADFKRFVRTGSAKGLDPLLNELHFEYRNDRNSATGVKGSIVIHQDGLLKIAHRSGKLDGIEQAQGKDERDWYVETAVTKKDCSKPFVFRAYYREFVAVKQDGSPTYMWDRAPYNMTAKCSRAGALRIAFPEELGGIMATEEMEIDERAINGGYAPVAPPPNPATAIVEKPEPKSESKPEPVKAEVKPEPKAETPTSSPRRETPAATADPKPIDPKTDATNAYKQRLAVLVGPNSDHAKAGVTKAHVDAFSIGYFGVENKSQCPRDPAQHIAMLDDLILQLAEPENRDKFKQDATKFGTYRRTVLGDFAKLDAKKAKNPELAAGFAKQMAANPAMAAEAVAMISTRAELKKRFNWNDQLCGVASVFMNKVGIESVDDLKNVLLDPAGLTGLTEPQIQTALEIGYYGAEPLSEAMNHAKRNKIPLAELKAEIEKFTGGPLASWKIDPAKVAEGVKLAISASTPTKKQNSFVMPGGK